MQFIHNSYATHCSLYNSYTINNSCTIRIEYTVHMQFIYNSYTNHIQFLPVGTIHQYNLMKAIFRYNLLKTILWHTIGHFCKGTFAKSDL